MNSGALQENFPEVYREFFSKCEIVVSAPRSFFWFGDNVTRYGELGVRQKLPLRAYVGLELTNDGHVSFAPQRSFIPSDGEFRTSTFRAPQLNSLARFLEGFCGHHRLTPGWRIHSLQELPVGSGLGAWAPLATALGAVLLLRTNELRPETLTAWGGRSSVQLAADPVFDRLLRLSWKMETLLEGEVSPGCGLFTAMVSSPSPIVFATEQREGYLRRIDLGVFDRYRYWGGRLHELFDLPLDERWPVDFGLVYTGSNLTTDLAVQAGRDVKHALNQVLKSTTATLRQHVPPSLLGQLVLTKRTRQQPEALWEAYLSALEATTLQGLAAFRQLFDEGYTERALSELAHAIDVFNGGLEIFHVSSRSVELTRHYLSRAATKEETILASKVTGAGRGGDVLFVIPRYALEHSIDSIMSTLREKVGTRTNLDYASWLDGIEERGLVVEQYLAAGQTSPLISAGTALIKTWSRGNVSAQAVSVDRLEKVRKNYDLFFDPLERKIFIRGEPLNSKQLHSRKVTTAVLQVLLANLGKSVGSQKLAPSTYVDRTTMQGKIIGPLVHIIKEKTGKKLPLTISGGLRKNFSLKLEVNGLTIGLLEKRL
ncbi:MAG: hypothetical protein HY567_02610 [Candidatus Kerfeldbacteria bacterium]|nr:hypothetical protein [Candidatus Kerfeldbacteria bacterium]